MLRVESVGCIVPVPCSRCYAIAMNRKLTDQQLIAKLREKPYSRVCREAAERLEELLREKAAREGRPDPKAS